MAVKLLGVHIVQDLVPGDLGIELPVEVTEELDTFDSGGGHQVLDAPLLPFEGFLVEKAVQELLLLWGQGVRVGQKPEVLPDLTEGHRSHRGISLSR